MTHLVVGGGVAGLTAAHYLSKLPSTKRIVLLEGSNRLGGWIDTTRHKDGVITEGGPRTLRPAGQVGANTLALAEELGLADKIRPVKYGHPSSVNRLVLVGGKLHKLPSTLSSVFRNLPPFDRPLAMAAFRDATASVIKCDDVSLYEFVERRLGKDIASYAVDPLVRGICAGNARDVSVNFIAKYLFQKEQEDGSIGRGVVKDWIKGWFVKEEKTEEEKCDLVIKARKEKWSVWGLEGGMTTLVEALEKRLRRNGVEIYTGEKVDKLEFKDGQVLAHGCVYDNVVCSVPAYAAADMLLQYPALANILQSIPFVSTAVVQLEYDSKVLDVEAFGFLVPSNQPEPILGCIFDTCTFPQGDRTVLTVMMGGAWFDDVVGGKTEEEVEMMARRNVEKILRIDASPVRTKVRFLKNCIAQYTVGHLQRVRQARSFVSEEGLPLHLVGSSYDGVGINDTIVSSKKAVMQKGIL